MGKLLLLTLNEQEETAIDKIISAISDYIQIEPMQITTASVLSFPGLEIKQNQRQVFQDGEEVSLTRLEYSTLVYLASNPGIVLTRLQIFVSSHGHKYLKPFGTWKVKAASQALQM